MNQLHGGPPARAAGGRRARIFVVLCSLFSAGAVAPVVAQAPVSHASEIHDHLRHAAEYLKANDPQSATRELDAVLALDPANAEANADLGVIAFFGQNYTSAAKYLRAALASDPSLTKSQALLGISERRLGDPGAMDLLAKSFPVLKDKSLRIQTGLELANIYYQQGDLDRASATMLTLVDLDPDNVEILYMAQRVYYELGDDTLNKLAIVAPASARMQQVIAERLVNEGDLKRAAEYFRRALAINPHLAGVRFELAEAILDAAPNDSSARDQAEQELETAVKSDGDSGGAECLAARIASLRGDQEGAYNHYRKAIALSPESAEAQVGLSRALERLEKPAEAVKYLRQAIQSDPLNAEAHYRLASLYRQLQMNEASDQEYRLFREIKEAKDRVAALYSQMNRRAPGSGEQIPATESRP